MLRHHHCVPGFAQTMPGGRSAHPAGTGWAIAAALQSSWEAFREALAAHRHYERLTSRGVPHDTALREALGFGSCPARMPGKAKPLYWAGKA